MTIIQKEEPMSDLISRQAAIDAIENAFDRETILNRFVRKIAISAVRLLPSAQPEQRWIPCKTALPKENGQYIVTVKYEHVDGYEDIYSEHGEWVDGHWDDGYGHCGRVEKVLAWMPLPEPYKAESEDKE